MKIIGTVASIRYHDNANGYTVFTLLKDDETSLTVTGTFPSIQKKESLIIVGEMTVHPKYGEQFQAEYYEKNIPSTKKEILSYIKSGMIKGIGPKKGELLVKTFGDKTLDILENHPGQVAAVKGFSIKKANHIAEQMRDRNGLQLAMATLVKYGITAAIGKRLYMQYKSSLLSILQENPYQVADDVKGIGFKKADEIAASIGIPRDSDQRLRAAFFYVLKNDADGHTYYPEHVLLAKAMDVLTDFEDAVQLSSVLNREVQEDNLIRTLRDQQNAIYLPEIFRQEKRIVRYLKSLCYPRTCQQAEKRVDEAERYLQMEYDAIQKETIRTALTNNLMILTGGPGTGKTSTIKGILRAIHLPKEDVLLLAPTGRAAKRISESTGMTAKTIHRALEIDPEKGFAHGEDNPLSARLIIVDESSMIDQSLFCSLLAAVRPTCRLILVGDKNQLPSVRPGNVLEDLIRSGICPVVELKKIFRQDADNEIITAAHGILEGKSFPMSKKNLFFIDTDDGEKCLRTIKAWYEGEIERFTRESEIQILAPIYNGVTGVTSINNLLQGEPTGEGITKGNKVFQVGDKVIHMKNDYEMLRTYTKDDREELGVFNGDTGVVAEVDQENASLIVRFDQGLDMECEVLYTYQDLDKLELAFAITIHKSQGSEYPVVIIPVFAYIPGFTNMNLIYTAITRASKYAFLLGSKKKFYSMIHDRQKKERYSGLMEAILYGKNNQN